MANCKFCGTKVRIGTVFHSACWEREVEKTIQVFCDEYCRYPRELHDEEALNEKCDNCLFDRLVDAGLN